MHTHSHCSLLQDLTLFSIIVSYGCLPLHGFRLYCLNVRTNDYILNNESYFICFLQIFVKSFSFELQSPIMMNGSLDRVSRLNSTQLDWARLIMGGRDHRLTIKMCCGFCEISCVIIFSMRDDDDVCIYRCWC